MQLTKKGMAQQKKGKPLKSDDIEKLEKMGRERGKKFKSLGSHVSDNSLPDSVETGLTFSELKNHLSHCTIDQGLPIDPRPCHLKWIWTMECIQFLLKPEK